MWSRYVGPPTPLLPLDTAAVPILQLVLKPQSLRILSLLGVRDLLEQKGDMPLQMPGVHVAYDGPDATVYANDNALPRTWLVDGEKVVSGDQAQLTAIGSAGFDPHSVIFGAHKVQAGELYLVRDPLQVLTAYEAGVENVVAFLTTITAQQLEQLASLMDEKKVETVELF